MIRNAQTESKVCGSESGLQTEDKGAIASDKEGHTASANVITARRTKDGYIKFDVKISHIIEQVVMITTYLVLSHIGIFRSPEGLGDSLV